MGMMDAVSWLLLLLQLLVVDVVGGFCCFGVSCFWLALLELVLSPWRMAG
jgi:hypothetical protein